MHLNAKIVIQPCGCESFTCRPELMPLAVSMVKRGYSFVAALVEVELQLTTGLWIIGPQSLGNLDL